MIDFILHSLGLCTDSHSHPNLILFLNELQNYYRLVRINIYEIKKIIELKL